MRKEKRNQREKGITLIALIITIIILIILAGITMVALSGENGILKQATEAKDKTEQAQLEEEVNLKILEKETDKNIDKDRGMEEYLNEVQNATVEKLGEGVWLVTRENAEVTVYESGEILEGKIDVWNGSKVEAPEIKEFNWYIYNVAQLKFLADFVNNGNTLTEEQKTLVAEKGYNESDIVITEDTIVYLMANIDLGARSTNGELTSGTAWTPIGTTSDLKFTGTFEGNNNTIRGVYVNVEDGAGIFGYSDKIQNLTVQDSYIKANKRAGGIVGSVKEGRLINCHNINTIVEVETDRAGGIAGQFQGNEMINCTNNAQVSGKNYYIGGIVGVTIGRIKNCKNLGEIEGNTYTGGIVGGACANCIIKNCINNAKITAQTSYSGGIAGAINTSSIIERCSNNGEINGKGYYTGGIVGLIATDSKDPSDVTELNKISYCYNTAKVKSDVNVGGIVGAMAQYGSIVEKCYNIGDIEGTSSIGGIVGNHGRSSKIENSYNIGNVKGETGVGGITGKSYGSAGSITNSYNIGKVQGSTEIGGIIGRNPNSLIITNAYYLTGTADKDQGNLGGTELAKDKEYISTTFLTKSNETENIWKVDENKNNGYPILVELEPIN